MHQSFVSTPTPPPPNLRGLAGLRCRANTFLLSPQCQGSVGITIITLGLLPLCDFLLCRVGQIAGLLPSACPHKAELIPETSSTMRELAERSLIGTYLYS